MIADPDCPICQVPTLAAKVDAGVAQQMDLGFIAFQLRMKKVQILQHYMHLYGSLPAAPKVSPDMAPPSTSVGSGIPVSETEGDIHAHGVSQGPLPSAPDPDEPASVLAYRELAPVLDKVLRYTRDQKDRSQIERVREMLQESWQRVFGQEPAEGDWA